MAFYLSRLSSFQAQHRLQHLVDGRNQLGRSLEGPLELNQVGHLFVERDAAYGVSLAKQHAFDNLLICELGVCTVESLPKVAHDLAVVFEEGLVAETGMLLVSQLCQG